MSLIVFHLHQFSPNWLKRCNFSVLTEQEYDTIILAKRYMEKSAANPGLFRQLLQELEGEKLEPRTILSES